LLQSAQDNLVEAHIDLHPAKAGRGRLELRAGKFAGEHFVEHDAERVDVGAGIDLLRRGGLLRSHVARRAGDRRFFSRRFRKTADAIVLLLPHLWPF
jgi:hypothetical protein